MIFITNILKEEVIMHEEKPLQFGVNLLGKPFGAASRERNSRIVNPFWVMVQKEVTDHLRSWRFIVLLSIIVLTCIGSMYTGLSNIAEAVKQAKADDLFLFLKLYTVSDGSLPSYFIFVGFLGPLLGIGLGFDAINSEQSRGTINRILAQPIPRDFLINAKFMAALILVSVLFFALSFMVMGIGLPVIGIPPTPEEVVRILLFTFAAIVYVAFWLNLSILFSIRFQQSATSALSGMAIWLFFTMFYGMLVEALFKVVIPHGRKLSIAGEQLKLNILRVAPNQMFNDITASLLSPSVRSLGPLTMEQVQGAIPGPLPVGQSLLLVWPQFVGLLAFSAICFLVSYLLFMKREVKGS